jgi:hypothetical protein
VDDPGGMDTAGIGGREWCGGAGRRGVKRAAVLVDHIIGVKADEEHGAHLELVKVAVVPRDTVVRQEETGLVGPVAESTVPDPYSIPLLGIRAELDLVVAERRHPGSVRRGPGKVDSEVPPDLRLVVGIQMGAADVTIEQVEQGRGALDCRHREPGVVRGLLPGVAGRIETGRGRGQVAEAGKAEPIPSRRGRGSE